MASRWTTPITGEHMVTVRSGGWVSGTTRGVIKLARKVGLWFFPKIGGLLRLSRNVIYLMVYPVGQVITLVTRVPRPAGRTGDISGAQSPLPRVGAGDLVPWL